MQCVALCCGLIAVCYSALHSALQCVAVCCSVLQCVAVCVNESALSSIESVLQCVTVSYIVLQRGTVCCSVLLHVAVCFREHEFDLDTVLCVYRLLSQRYQKMNIETLVTLID